MSDQELRRLVEEIRESQQRLAGWMGAVGALLAKLSEQERDRFDKLQKP